MRLSTILTAAALVAVGTSALADSVGAKILIPVTLTRNPGGDGPGTKPSGATADMYFGTIVRGNGTVTLIPHETAVANARNTSLTVVGNDYWMPSYTLGATAGQAVTINVGPVGPATTVTVSNGTGGSMDVDQFTFATTGAASSTAAGGTITISSGTSVNFRLGARLTVTSATPSGDYTGTYNITAAY